MRSAMRTSRSSAVSGDRARAGVELSPFISAPIFLDFLGTDQRSVGSRQRHRSWVAIGSGPPRRPAGFRDSRPAMHRRIQGFRWARARAAPCRPDRATASARTASSRTTPPFPTWFARLELRLHERDRHSARSRNDNRRREDLGERDEAHVQHQDRDRLRESDGPRCRALTPSWRTTRGSPRNRACSWPRPTSRASRPRSGACLGGGNR